MSSFRSQMHNGNGRKNRFMKNENKYMSNAREKSRRVQNTPFEYEYVSLWKKIRVNDV